MPHEYVEDLTSDVMFRATGASLKEVFEESARAMMGVMYDLGKVRKERKVEIEVSAADEKELLYRFLSAILAQFEISEMLFCGFNIAEISETGLRAELWGGEVDTSLIQTLVKGVTMHKFSLSKEGGKYTSTVVVDR